MMLSAYTVLCNSCSPDGSTITWINLWSLLGYKLVRLIHIEHVYSRACNITDNKRVQSRSLMESNLELYRCLKRKDNTQDLGSIQERKTLTVLLFFLIIIKRPCWHLNTDLDVGTLNKSKLYITNSIDIYIQYAYFNDLHVVSLNTCTWSKSNNQWLIVNTEIAEVESPP